MNINETFPSKYLKAEDLQGRRAVVIMADVKTEEVGQKRDIRAVLYFKGKSKGMVLNKTNARKISEAYGPETDSWFGQAIELYEAQVEFQGDTVPALRVAIPRSNGNGNGGAGQVTFTQRAQQPVDRVPDPAPTRREPPRAEAVHQGTYSDTLNDDIPF